MNKKEYEALRDGDMVENIETKRKYVVRIDDREVIPKLTLVNYQEQFKVISKVVRTDHDNREDHTLTKV